jgi:hypothetical protein
MKEALPSSKSDRNSSMESPGIAWLLATFVLIAIIFLPFILG